MIPYIKKYGEQKTRHTVVSALYIATGAEGRKLFKASEIRRYAIDEINRRGELGSLSTETINRVLAPVNGDVLEFADRERGLYQLKEIKLRYGNGFLI